MSRTYELWDGPTRNLVAAYDCESDALAFIQQYVAEHGSAYASSWALLWDDDDVDEAEQVAEGFDLLALAASATNRPTGLTERRA